MRTSTERDHTPLGLTTDWGTDKTQPLISVGVSKSFAFISHVAYRTFGETKISNKRQKNIEHSTVPTTSPDLSHCAFYKFLRFSVAWHFALDYTGDARRTARWHIGTRRPIQMNSASVSQTGKRLRGLTYDDQCQPGALRRLPDVSSQERRFMIYAVVNLVPQHA